MKHIFVTALLFASANAFAQNTFTAIYNIFQSKCASCHSGGTPAGSLNLSGTEAQVYNAIVEVAPANATAAAKGDKLIDKGYPDRSFLLRKCAYGLSDDLALTAGEGNNEPNGQAKLSDQEIELVRQWILKAAPQTGNVVNYQRLIDYYTLGGKPKITRPPAPPAGQGYQIHFGPVFWGEGEEVEYFKKFDPRFPQALDAYRFELYMNAESHHFIIRKFRPGTEQNWSDGLEPLSMQSFDSDKDFVNAWQTSTDLELPVGTAFFWDDNTVLDLNYHMKNPAGGGILPGGDFQSLLGRRQIQVVGLDPGGAPVGRRIRVNRQKQVGTPLIGEFRARLERHKGVVRSGVDYLHSQPLLEQSSQAFRDIQHQFLFQKPALAAGALIVAAVAGINHDPAHFES